MDDNSKIKCFECGITTKEYFDNTPDFTAWHNRMTQSENHYHLVYQCPPCFNKEFDKTFAEVYAV